MPAVRRSACSAHQSCPTISAVVRLRLKPWRPVEQNRQFTAQPAWVEMHSVPRSSSGMNTVSIALPAPTSSSHLRVPSDEVESRSTLGATISACSASFDRNDFARSVIASNSPAPCW